MTRVFKTIDVGTVSAGGSTSDSVTADKDYKIEKIIAVEKSGASLTNVTATLRIDDFVFTRDKIPLSVLQGYMNQVPELGYDWSKGSTLYYSVANDGTSDVNIYLVLVLEE